MMRAAAPSVERMAAGIRVGSLSPLKVPTPSGVGAVARALATALLIASAGLMGYFIATGHAGLVALAAVAAASVFLAVYTPGPFVAIMLLAILNGIPGVDLGGRVGPLRIQDAVVVALIVVLGARGRQSTNHTRRLVRSASLWAGLMMAWWVITVARSVLLSGIGLQEAVSFGRDFLYFAILVPLALRAAIPSRSLKAGGIVLCGGVLTYAIGQITTSLTGAKLPWLIHSQMSSEVGGLTRLYSPMGDLVVVSLIFSLALLLSREGRRMRLVLSGLAGVLLLAAALAFTRASYFALPVALVVALTVYTMTRGSLTAVTVRAAMLALAVMLVMPAMIASGIGTSNRLTSAVTDRVEAGVENVSHSNGTFGYRRELDGKMLAILGDEWPIGLGYLHPTAYYVAGLPAGSIRNTDTGVLNALMTMGIVGTILLYIPLAFAFMGFVRLSGRVRGSLHERPSWPLYGGVAWVTWLVVGSATLVVLFSVAGLVLTALVLAAVARSAAIGE